ncbi:hypothetical protein PV05_05824 [Exophiala xenobiotica]|uniref:Glutathione S-transferase UstS-like C-terminal domain-containing protein n=1 Tax=Exophiala xenobiotica TaxID=348802 RepID=A0A0D2EP14_9EURO|nr:uncharacterized protein PV05_05824 [Exophiala xenobiotica]KIW57248.1 hypothetical protein PV05_05824 [Exophiala xenobiotica]
MLQQRPLRQSIHKWHHSRPLHKLTRPPRIHFFDIKSRVGPFSPNTLRTRLSLNYKRLTYTESSISYPDIEPLCKSLDIPPAHHDKSATTPRYTLPALLIEIDDKDNASPLAVARLMQDHHGHCSATSVRHPNLDFGPAVAVSTTLAIAQTLDAKFPGPEYPALFPFADSEEQARHTQRTITRAVAPARRLVIPSVPDILDERGREYFDTTRRTWFKVDALNELRPKSEAEEKQLWRGLQADLDGVIGVLRREQGGVEAPFLNGHVPTYADFVVMAFLAWFHRVDRRAWDRVLEFGNGELKTLWAGCKRWLDGRGEQLEWEVE